MIGKARHGRQIFRLSHNAKAYQRETYELRIMRLQFVQGNLSQLLAPGWLCVRFAGDETL
jgi:hypothetical protein